MHRALTSEKSEGNIFIEVFACDGGKYCLTAANIIKSKGFIFSKRDIFYVLTTFSSYIRPASISFEDKNSDSLIILLKKLIFTFLITPLQ